MQSTTTPRFPIQGSTLAADLRTTMSGLGYTSVSVAGAIAHVEHFGTVAGCESVEPEDVEAIDDLIRRYTANVECSSASDWPGAWDDAVWVPTPGDEPAPADEPFHPEPDDAAAAAVLLNADADADHDDHAVRYWLDGLSCHADRITDEDMQRSGAVG